MKKEFGFIIIFISTLLTYGQSNEELEFHEDSIVLKDGGVYRILLSRYHSKEHNGHRVSLTFSHDLKNGGSLIDAFEFDKDPIAGCRPELLDYNGDGYLDYSFVSAVAARGANEIRTILLYNPQNSRFYHLKNSDHYPNLIYNSKLKCMDSWAFHGGTTQYFLELNDDSLTVTHSIDIRGTERILSKVEQGKYIELRTDTIEDVGFIRYSSFNPFEE